jgi:hypothetical protein
MFQGFIDAAEENQSDKPMHSEEPPEMNLFNQDLFANEATSKNVNKFDFKLPSNDTPSLFGTISNSDAPLEPKSETPPQTLNAPIFGNSSLFEENQSNDDTDVLKLLNLFHQDCNLSTSFNIQDLVNEVNSIRTENEQELERMIQQKVQKVVDDAKKGTAWQPLPCQSEKSKELLELLASHWKNKHVNGKKRFQSRKQNSKRYRKSKRGADYNERLAAKASKSKRKRKMKNRRRFKPYS